MKLTIFTLCLLAFLFAFSTQTFAVDFTDDMTILRAWSASVKITLIGANRLEVVK